MLFKWRAPSLLTDRCEFTDESGAQQLTPPYTPGTGTFPTPNAAAARMHSGSVQPVYALDIHPSRTDADGWQYALDFPSTYYLNNYTLAAVRRRKWVLVSVL